MPSRLIDTLLQMLSLAEQLEEQTPPNPITHAALLHALQDAMEEVESIGTGTSPQEIRSKSNLP